MRQGIAYRLTFQNGKVYIGITRESLERRIKRHIAYARSGKSFALSSAIRKYGEDSFKSEVVGSGSWDELKSIEVRLIKEHGSFGCGGYNMTGGGDGALGVHIPEHVKTKIADSLRGRKLTDEHRQRVSESQKGKTISEETKEKMRKAAANRCARAPMGEKQKEKIRASLLGRKQSAERIAKRVEARRTNGSY